MCDQINTRKVKEFIYNITGNVPYRYSATEIQDSIIFHKLLDYLKKQNRTTFAQESYDLWKDIDFQGYPYRMINPDAQDWELYYQDYLTKSRLSILYLNIALSLFLVQKYPNILDKLSETSKKFYSKLVKKILDENWKHNLPLLAFKNFNTDYIDFRGFSKGSPKFLVDVKQKWLLQILDCNKKEVFKDGYSYVDQSHCDESRLNEIPRNERLALSYQYVNAPNNPAYKELSSGFKTSFIAGFEFIDQVQVLFKNSAEFSEIDNDGFFDDFINFITNPNPLYSSIPSTNFHKTNNESKNMSNTEELDIPENATKAVNKAIHQTKLSVIKGSYSALRKEDVEPILEEQPCTNTEKIEPYTLSLKRDFGNFVYIRNDNKKEYQNQFIVNFKHLLDKDIPDVKLDDIEWLNLYIIVKRGESWEMLDYTEIDGWIEGYNPEDDYFDNPRLIIMNEDNDTLIHNIKLATRVGLALDCFPDCIYAVLAIDISR